MKDKIENTNISPKNTVVVNYFLGENLRTLYKRKERDV